MGKLPKKVEDAIALFDGDPLRVLDACDGFYECPKDDKGRRLGPLVGYAGKYDGVHQFVGDVYANFAKAEKFPRVLALFAQQMHRGSQRNYLEDVDAFCGAPMGGIAFALLLAWTFDARFVYMEKKITALATEGSREQSKLVWGRHEIHPGDKVAIIEDVINNFSTTDVMLDLITKSQGQTVAIASLLNCSPQVDMEYKSIPIVSLVRKKIREYRQDDLEVAADVQAGNVCWKPKNDWDPLAEIMARRK